MGDFGEGVVKDDGTEVDRGTAIDTGFGGDTEGDSVSGTLDGDGIAILEFDDG